MAYKYVRENFSGDKAVLDLYDKIGQPIEFIEDTNSPSGILWVNEAPRVDGAYGVVGSAAPS